MTRAASARPAAATAKPAPVRKLPKGYFHQSELPLASLVFVIPFILLYELGTGAQIYDMPEIRASKWMRDFFHFFGASGRYLPPLAVVVILLAWHWARRDPWLVNIKHQFLMFLESIVLAIPLMLLGLVTAHYVPLFSSTGSVFNAVVLSAGAGVYEELVFRLIAFVGLSLLFVDALGMPRARANLLMVVLSSLAFSLYHYLGNEVFVFRTFVFRTLAGFYFGALFTFRGFGITAGCHAFYDIIISCFRLLS